MRVVLYDYESEKTRGKVRKNLKKIGIHAQWSVFESEEEFKKIKNILLKEEGRYRIAVFRINLRGKILKIGREWEALKTIF